MNCAYEGCNREVVWEGLCLFHRKQERNAEECSTNCDGTGTYFGCDTNVPHDHCACLMPMAIGAGACAFCKADQEGRRTHLLDQTIREGREHLNHQSPDEQETSRFKLSTDVYQWGGVEQVNSKGRTKGAAARSFKPKS